MICHHCGFSKKIINTCQFCGTEGQIKACGPGVERIEEEIKYFFPEAEIAVLSSDTMRSQKLLIDMIEKIKVEDFANQGFNIDAKLLDDINDGEYNLYVVGDGQYKLARGTPGEPDFLIAGDKNGNEIILNALKYYGFAQ